MNKLKWLLLTAIVSLSVIMPSVVNAAAMKLFYDGAYHNYDGSLYSLYVNGDRINADIEPILFNDHALVPIREVFEKCGATVDYDGATKCVEVQYGLKYIRLYINDNTAYVNGKLTEIPDNVVPKLINKPGGLTKTMVPVRFISEAAGMGVEFDSSTGSINLSAEPVEQTIPEENVVVDEPEEEITIPTEEPMMQPDDDIIVENPTEEPMPVEKVDVIGLTNKMLSRTSMQVDVTCSGSIGDNLSYFRLDSPERVVVDFANMGFTAPTNSINTNGDGINTIRVGLSEERARIVIDLEKLKTYTVTQTSDTTVKIIVNVEGSAQNSSSSSSNSSSSNSSSSNSNTSSAIQYATGFANATDADARKVIMLDAGHGGSDSGAIGTLDGKTINEKDLTLSITYKVKAILEKYGYSTSMTRTGDTLPSLSERPAQANAEGCALFCSIHINSAESSEAKGTEVFWSEENNGSDYGLTSKTFAGNVLNSMLKYMESTNRGVKMANWAVIRRSDMPAILAEVGFISNENELRKMCSDSYQNEVAAGIAEGIINTVHYVSVP